ncbi:MAG: MFS transporter [Micromonosporaceae bacterium]
MTTPPLTAPERGSLWRAPDFRKLFAGATVSWFGSKISELAIPLLMIGTLHASATEVGLARAAQFLPFLLFTLYAGVLVDRVRRRPLMIAADLGRFAVIGVMPVLIWSGIDQIEPLYLLIFTAGSLTVLHQLADMAYLPTLVGPDRLLTANSKLGASQAAADMSGQGVGGLLVAWLTAPFAVLVDAASYLISGLLVFRIRAPEPSPAQHMTGQRDSLRADVAEGFSLLLRSRNLRALLGEATTFNLAHEVFMIGLLLWLARDLDVSAALIGLVVSLSAVGAFIGAATGARLSARYGFGRTMVVTLTIGNSAPLAVALSADGGAAAIALLGAVFLVMGFGIALANVHNVTLRQTAIPEHLRGRVNAAYRLVSWGALPVGGALGGLLTAQLGSRPATLAGAVGIAVATLWVVFSPIPRLRESPQTIDEPARSAATG